MPFCVASEIFLEKRRDSCNNEWTITLEENVMTESGSLTNKTIKELTEMITVKQIYHPGDKLPNENILAEQLGVSRTTLRDAITHLVSSNVLERRRGKGTFVVDNKQLGDDYGFNELNFMHVRLKDLYELRLILEPEMTAIATQNATEKELEEIIRCADEIEASPVENEDNPEMNKRFHNAIAVATHNEFIIRLYQNISTATVIAFGSESVIQKNDSLMLWGHRMITETMLRRDPEGAKLAMRLHIKQSIDFYGLNL